MSAPLKPWENANSFREQSNMHNNYSHARNVLNSNAPPMSHNPTAPVRVGPPQLPPRPPQLAAAPSRRSLYGMNHGYSNMYGGYSAYGGYPSFGGYTGNIYPPGSYGYGAYGQHNGAFENRFLQVAEESSRDAFQSIESLVRAFTSVSMMLESTYHAMYSSFRAILGVVDNFSRLRQLFAQFVSAITILKILKNFYRRLLHWLGIINHIPQPERVWEAAAGSADSSQQASTYSSWPLFTFIGLLFGGPYLVSKLFSSEMIEQKKWDPKKGIFYKTAYPHEAASPSELSFQENETLNIAPKEFQLPNCGGGWLLASNKQGQVGYVPITLFHKTRVNPKSEKTVSNEAGVTIPVAETK